MPFSATERRKAPRFSVDCFGELASGACVFRVRIVDMSVTGCGIEILESAGAEEDACGSTGILGIARAGRVQGVLLPVVVGEERLMDRMRRLGLQFRRFTPAQMRKLIAVMDALIPDPR